MDTAEYWIDKLKLTPHPGLETGYLNEVFRDNFKVNSTEGKPRDCSTNIYFLHKKGTAHVIYRISSFIAHCRAFN